MITVSCPKGKASQIQQKSVMVLGNIQSQYSLQAKMWKDIDENPPFSELMNWSSFISRTYFFVKSGVYIMNLIPAGASAMKKAGKYEQAQLQALISNSRWICWRDMLQWQKTIPDFEILDKVTKLSPNEHWVEVEKIHVLKVLNCFLLHNTGQS